MEMPKVSHEFYFNCYCSGRAEIVPKTDFDFFVRRATDELSAMCTGEILPVHEESIKNCICEMAEKLFEMERLGNKKSESIDGYSVSYRDDEQNTGKLWRIASKHLMNTGLLYKGVATC